MLAIKRSTLIALLTVVAPFGVGAGLRKRTLQQTEDALVEDWCEDGHDGLIDLGVKQLQNFPAEPEIINFNFFWNNIDFRQGAFRGIEEADAESLGEYSGPFYASHYYDPDTGCSFGQVLGICFETSGLFGFFGMNAKSEGTKRMDNAVSLGKDIAFKVAAGDTVAKGDFYDCGFQLGLGLHYLTDLVQPMHAANFAGNIGDNFFFFLPNSRHLDFELVVDDLVDAGYLDDTPPIVNFAEITSVGIDSASDILESTARLSKDVWTTYLESKVPSVNPFTLQHGDFDQDDVEMAVDMTLKDYGYRKVAQYLNYFGRLAVAP